jgi:DNA repair protein RecO (recombination protein O)
MAHPRYETLQGFVLHSQPIGESHYRITLLTRERGKVNCLLKGTCPERARQLELKASISEHNIQASNFRYTNTLLVQSASAKYLVLYVNELSYHLVQSGIADDQLYACYMTTLIKLNHKDEAKRALRFFELSLLEYLGQGINFQFDRDGALVLPNQRYQFLASVGFVMHPLGPFTGEQVMAASELNTEVKGAMSCARAAMRLQLEACLDGRTLNSRHWLTPKKSD